MFQYNNIRWQGQLSIGAKLLRKYTNNYLWQEDVIQSKKCKSKRYTNSK